jgi:hypothetical protein
VVPKLKTAWRDGNKNMEMSPLEFMQPPALPFTRACLRAFERRGAIGRFASANSRLRLSGAGRPETATPSIAPQDS